MFRFFVFVFLMVPTALFSQGSRGRIVRMIEGDIFLFQTRDSTFRVNMYGIDAPEPGQAFSDKTVEFMETFLWAEAEIRIKKNINQTGISAVLYINDRNMNKELVKRGYAWHNKIHSNDAELARAEMRAREKKEGLWIDVNPASPWDFRKGKLPPPPPVDGQIKVLICTNNRDLHYHKKYCRELIRCHSNIIVIMRKQAKDIKMKACRYCY